MTSFFKCKHNAADLAVLKESTSRDDSKYPDEFLITTHHLLCMKCQEHVDISFAENKLTFSEARAKYRKQKL